MALSWTSTIRDQVAYSVFGVAYSSCRSDETAFMDASGSVPTSTPGGAAGVALSIVGQYAQWFGETGTTAANLPSVLDHVLIAEVAIRCAVPFRRADYPLHAKNRQMAWQTFMESYTPVDFGSSSTTVTQNDTITWSALRLHVMRHCLRRNNNRSWLFPAPASVDAAINWAWKFLWKRAGQNFSVRQAHFTFLPETDITVTNIAVSAGDTSVITAASHGLTSGHVVNFSGTNSIPTLTGPYKVTVLTSNTFSIVETVTGLGTTGTATVDPLFPAMEIATGETFAGVASRWLTYDGNQTGWPSSPYDRMRYVDVTRMAELKAQYGSNTGRPAFFHIEDHGAAGGVVQYKWQLVPITDQSYTARGAVYIQPPDLPTSATAGALTQLPTQFLALIPDLVLGKVLKDHNAVGWEESWKTAMDEVEALARTYASLGDAEDERMVGADVYMDHEKGGRYGGEGL